MTKANGTGKLERDARLRWIALGDMRISATAQRELNPSRVDKILSDFDPEQMGTPTVSERDGNFFILDGQHRVAAFRAWIGDDWKSQKIQCWTYTGLTEADESETFLKLNDVLTVDAYSKFRVGVNAGREVETEIDRVVRAQGLVVSRDKIAGAIAAVGTLRRAYSRSGSAVLGRTLRIIRDAYGDAGLEAAVIDGVNLLAGRYNGDLDDVKAIKQLGNTHGGVNGLLNQAEVLRQKTGNAKGHCVAAAAVTIINRGKGGKKLPSWWREDA